MFPSFNIYSTPLLVLVLQGLLFAGLLLYRYYKEKYLPDLLLGVILLITCWQRTTYTIGFMGWYDTFRNTKINYYLLSGTLLMAPLLYLYVKSVTVAGFRWMKGLWIHFIPFAVFVTYRAVLLTYDAMQPGYADTQNGVLMNGLNDTIASPIISVAENVAMILYLAFTLQAYFQYKSKLTAYYSNTYKLELTWLRNFLLVYAFLFVYSIGQLAVNVLIVDLHWTQKWWYHFFSGLAIIYVGIKGYFTRTDRLSDLEFNTVSSSSNSPQPIAQLSQYEKDVQKIEAHFEQEAPYLNPDLTLKTLAQQLDYSTNQMSEVINGGFQKNFNDLVNGYRVDAVKLAIQQGEHHTKSLVGIAMDCGFNSKPTFNRVFKKLSGLSPSQYAKTLEKE